MTKKAQGAGRYIVGDVPRFDQRYDMYKRVRWDPNLKELGRKLWNPSLPKGKEGYTLLERAFENAGWYVEMAFAKGIQIHDFGLYSWEPPEGAHYHALPPGAKMQSADAVQMSGAVKKVAAALGSCLTGICELDPRWIYSHSFHFVTREHKEMELPPEIRYAVVVAIEMDYDMVKTSPSAVAGSTVGIAYSQMAFVAGSLAQFIRDLGYQAFPSGNDTGLNVPLAIDAGMGELGRHGILITKDFGPRVRLAKVLTDLPLEPDPPIDLGVLAMCEKCKKCASYCPGQAISHEERTTERLNVSNNVGALKWPVNAEKCLSFWAANGTTCTNCI
ncbi:MAG: reductive dehalogenase, partial [Dehalococcoidia bacterium]|nr:reductive dehalogenase [Dehalococcoidia bacterium]